jgi:hypothetical protein
MSREEKLAERAAPVNLPLAGDETSGDRISPYRPFTLGARFANRKS